MPTNPNQNTTPTDNESSTPQRVQEENVPTRDDATSSETLNARPPENRERNEAVVRTFKDDIQHLVRNQKLSMTHIAAAESDRRGREEPRAKKEIEPNKTPIIIGLTVLFITIAIVFGLGFYYIQQRNSGATPITQIDPPIILTQARQSVDITDLGARLIIESLATIRRTTFASLGSVVELYLTRVVKTSETDSTLIHVTSTDFLNLIEAHVSQAFKQSLNPKYILGIHTIDENVPFLVLTTNSYGHSFSGMLAWEKYIEEDLLPLFSPNAEFVKPATAEGDNAFTDDVVENLDVRILHDSTGKVRILYAFVNRTSVIITTDVRTLIEIANRLRAQ